MEKQKRTKENLSKTKRSTDGRQKQTTTTYNQKGRVNKFGSAKGKGEGKNQGGISDVELKKRKQQYTTINK